MSSINFSNPRVCALRILAIETTERQGSIAISESGSLQHHQLPADDRSAATLAPEIKAICAAYQWRLENIDRFAVTTGPGSFTGLRVGIVTTKTLVIERELECRNEGLHNWTGLNS